MPSRAMEQEELLLSPATLPVVLSDVKVERGDDGASNATVVTVNEDGLSWDNEFLTFAQIVLHGIAPSENGRDACVYLQIESAFDSELRFVPARHADIAELFRALSAGAVLAEDALRAEEASKMDTPDDDTLFARRADGSVGPVDFDALITDPRYEDADNHGADAEAGGAASEAEKNGGR
eukprot:IDg7621t1